MALRIIHGRSRKRRTQNESKKHARAAYNRYDGEYAYYGTPYIISYPYIPYNICTYVVHGYRYTYISRYVYILLYDARDRYTQFSGTAFPQVRCGSVGGVGRVKTHGARPRTASDRESVCI